MIGVQRSTPGVFNIQTYLSFAHSLAHQHRSSAGIVASIVTPWGLVIRASDALQLSKYNIGDIYITQTYVLSKIIIQLHVHSISFIIFIYNFSTYTFYFKMQNIYEPMQCHKTVLLLPWEFVRYSW